MRIWKIISNSVGEISLVSKPGSKPIAPNEQIKVVDVKALVELMEACDRYLLTKGDDRVFAESIRWLRDKSEIHGEAG
jgi:hypothetical protein